MEVILGVLLGWAIAASVIAAFRLIRPPRVISDEQRAMQEALHAATATLPQLRRGLSADSSAKTVGHLLTLTQARAVALLDSGRVLAFAGAGVDHHDPSEWVALATQASRDDRLHVEKPHQMLGIRAARSAARCWHRSSSERSAWGRSWRCSPAAGA